MTAQSIRVFLVDDEEALRIPLKEFFVEHFGFEVVDCENPEEGLAWLQKDAKFDVALVDNTFPPEYPSGIEFTQQIKTRYPDIEVIIFTGWDPQLEEKAQALQAGALRYIAKPFDPQEMGILIRHTAQQVRLRKIGRVILAEQDKEQLLNLIAGAAQSLTNADEAFIALYQAGNGKVELYPRPLREVGWRRHFHSMFLTKHLVETGEIIRIPDTTQDDRVEPALVESGIRSFLGVPIPGPDHNNLGVLYLYSKVPGTLMDGATLSVVRTLANQAGLALANIWALHQAQMRAEKLKAVYEVSRALTTITQPQKLYDEICRRAVQFFHVDHSGLVLFDEATEKEKIVGEYPPEIQAKGTIIPIRGVRDEEHLVLDQEPLVVEDVANRASLGPVRDILLNLGIQSILIIPIIYQGRVLGSFSLDAIKRKRRFTQEEIEQCTLFANQAAMAIANTRLMATVQSAFQASVRVSESRAEEPRQVLESIAEEALHTGRAQAVSILLMDPSGKVKEKPVVAGVDIEEDIRGIVREKGISAHVMKTGQPVVIPDVERWDGDIPLNPAFQRNGIKSAVCLPLTAPKQPLGVMWVHYTFRHDFSEHEITALKLFANQAAAVYASVRTLRFLKKLQEVAMSFAQEESLTQVLQRIVDETKAVFQADSVTLWSYNPIFQDFILQESKAAGIPPEVWEELLQDPPKGRLFDHVLNEGLVVVKDIQKPESAPFMGSGSRRMIRQLNIRSFLGVKLEANEQVVGVLFINFDYPRSFDEKEKQTALALATHAAIALSRARLIDRLKQAQEAFKQISQKIAREDLTPTLRAITQATQRLFGADAIVLYDYEEETDTWGYPPTMVGVRYEEKVRELDAVKHSSIVYKMLARAEPKVVPDVSLDPDFQHSRFAKEEEIKSLIVFPLRVGGQKVGVMFVNFRNYRTFTEEGQRLMGLFADQAAIAIHQAHLQARNQRRIRLLERINESGKMISSSLNIEAILQALARQVWKLLHDEETDILLVTIGMIHESGHVKMVAVYPEEALKAVTDTLGQSFDYQKGVSGRHGVIGRAILTKTPQNVLDVREDADYLASHADTLSELAVPISIGDRVIGVINAESTRLNAFSELQARALESLAAYAAIAIENARFAEALRLAAETASIINRSAITDPNEILNHITTTARTLFEKPVSLMLWNEEKTALEIRSGRGLSQKFLDKQKILKERLDAYLKKLKARGHDLHQPITIEAREEGLGDRELIEKEGIVSILVAPMWDGDELLGVLNIYSRSPEKEFTAQDKDTAAILARHASIAILNARQYQELRRTKGLVGARTALAWMGMAASVWHHSVIGNAVVIRDQTELMKYDLPKVEPVPVRRRIAERREMIERKAKAILEKPITMPLGSGEGVKPISLSDFVRTRVEELWKLEPYRRLQLFLALELPENTNVNISKAWLRKAFDEIIENAVKAMEQIGRKEITVGTRSREGFAEIFVADSGPGIDPEIVALLGNEIIPEPKLRGMGMGLLMVSTILEAYGGEFYIEKSDETGTTAVIRLPIAR